MDLFRLIVDMVIVPIILWLIFLTLQHFDLKGRVSLVEREAKNNGDEMSKLEKEIKDELKSMNSKIDQILLNLAK